VACIAVAGCVLALWPSTLDAGTLQLILTSTASTSTGNTGVSGRVDISFHETATGDFMDLVLNNTSSAASRLTAAGFEIPSLPNIPVFASGGTSSYFDILTYNVGVSPGSLNAEGGYDLMITSEGLFEGGSPQGAPDAGQSQSVSLFLGDLPDTPASLEASFIAFYASHTGPLAIARFQAIQPGGNSDKVITTTVVPEPLTMMLSVGLALFALLPSRKAAPRC
jgi:hypothetical protein